ncbi:hypothetical protein GCM10011390_19960 [Aureimonas endophytica]|uniref:Uncharacterized protein n=1 Tax=Aureimonas endophytica TaxID=2027858 RepID=A0A916ZKL4_9HYPH|nr:hypothetical protein [Aureimonas endophytica]GGE01132.1 hypothetical protein GCM10011390_19960 [Aureimonas endophytica]
MQYFFETYPDNNGRTQFAPPFPAYVEDVVLAAGVLTRLAVPAGARYALFSFDGDVRVKLGDATTSFSLPSVTGSGGAGSELNPTARRIAGLPGFSGATTHLCLLAGSACTGSVSFFG